MIDSTTSSQAEVFCKNVDLGSVHNFSEIACGSGATTTSDHEDEFCENVDRGSAYSANLINMEESSDCEHESNNEYLKRS